MLKLTVQSSCVLLFLLYNHKPSSACVTREQENVNSSQSLILPSISRKPQIVPSYNATSTGLRVPLYIYHMPACIYSSGIRRVAELAVKRGLEHVRVAGCVDRGREVEKLAEKKNKKPVSLAKEREHGIVGEKCRQEKRSTLNSRNSRF